MEIVQQVFAVCAVLGLLLGFLWWMRRGATLRVNGWTRAKGAQRSLESVERLALTPQHALHLVKVQGRHMLIGVHGSGMTLLAKYPGERDENQPAKEVL